MQCGMLGMMFWQYSTDIPFIETFFITSIKECNPLFCITDCMQCGMLGMRFWQYYTDIPFIETFFITSIKAIALEGCLSATFLFRNVHNFKPG